MQSRCVVELFVELNSNTSNFVCRSFCASLSTGSILNFFGKKKNTIFQRWVTPNWILKIWRIFYKYNFVISIEHKSNRLYQRYRCFETNHNNILSWRWFPKHQIFCFYFRITHVDNFRTKEVSTHSILICMFDIIKIYCRAFFCLSSNTSTLLLSIIF